MVRELSTLEGETVRHLYVDEKMSATHIEKTTGIERHRSLQYLNNLAVVRTISEANKIAVSKGWRVYPLKRTDFVKFRRLHEEGMAVREISKQEGVAHETACRYIRKAGGRVRSPSKSRSMSWKQGNFTLPSRENHYAWKGRTVRLRRDGYIDERCFGHPRANKGGWVLQHILIWERSHGEPLPKGAQVHHINGIRNDNHPENLCKVTPQSHDRFTLLHQTQERIRELEKALRETQDVDKKASK